MNSDYTKAAKHNLIIVRSFHFQADVAGDCGAGEVFGDADLRVGVGKVEF